jgi:hypothetical protein
MSTIRGCETPSVRGLCTGSDTITIPGTGFTGKFHPAAIIPHEQCREGLFLLYIQVVRHWLLSVSHRFTRSNTPQRDIEVIEKRGLRHYENVTKINILPVETGGRYGVTYERMKSRNTGNQGDVLDLLI